MLKNSTLDARGRWLVSAVFLACALLPLPLATIGLPAQAASTHWVVAAVALVWLAPLYYCTLMGHHWARNVTGLALLGSLVLMLLIWAPAQTLLLVGLGLVAVTAAVLLLWAPALRSPFPW